MKRVAGLPFGIGRKLSFFPKYDYSTSSQITEIYKYVAPGLGNQNIKKEWKKISNMAPGVLQVINELKWKQPTPIQTKVLNFVEDSDSIVASAETGSGKTAAYAIPVINGVLKILNDPKQLERHENPEDTRRPRGKYSPLGLIICPTRELTLQVEEHIKQLSKYSNPKLNIVSLGQPITVEDASTAEITEEFFEKKIDILIGTPGKILTALKLHSNFLTTFSENQQYKGFATEGLDISWVKWFVIDECDKILSLGFFPDLQEIYSYLPRPRQKVPNITYLPNLSKTFLEGRKVIVPADDRMKILFFTATLVPEIAEFIKRIAPNHKLINLNTAKPASSILQKFHLVSNRRKYSLLKYYLERKASLRYCQVLVFCRTQQRAERLTESLKNDGFRADFLHSNFSQRKREAALEAFKLRKIQVLVATDVVGRGIDIPSLPYVVNYDVPINPVDYVHRIGRTGRAGEKGNAITFVSNLPAILNFQGRFVEHNETHLANKIGSFLKKPIIYSKVPGAWTDDIYDPIKKEEEFVAQQFKYKRETELKKLLQSKDEKVLGAGTLEILAARAKARMKKPPRVRYMTSITDGLSLRQFKHGRYEDMLHQWDVTRAKNRGVSLPEKATKKKKPKKSLYFKDPSPKPLPKTTAAVPFTLEKKPRAKKE